MRLEISCQDRLGITQDVLDILVTHQIDLRGIEIDPTGKIFLNFPNIEFEDFQHLMPQIRRISGIEDVKTIPFMPGEREKHQLSTILQTLPDPVFSVDMRGRIVLLNDAALRALSMKKQDIAGTEISELVKGFNFGRWLDTDSDTQLSAKVKFIQQEYSADLIPVKVPDDNQDEIIAGAVVILRSEWRLGQQINVFHQSNLPSFDAFITDSEQMNQVIEKAHKVARLEEPVLLVGELGTGKKSLAKACHETSRRQQSPFEEFDCASLPEELADKTLFGRQDEQGEESGGLWQKLSGGSLILTNIEALPIILQNKLAMKLGGSSHDMVADTEPTGVRLFATATQDLTEKVEQGTFSRSLYLHLTKLCIYLPSLRERKNDIVPLAESFVLAHSKKLGRQPATLSRACTDALLNHPWPGNVRQLQNTLFRSLSLFDGNEIQPENLQLPEIQPSTFTLDEHFEGSLDSEVKKFEKMLLERLYPQYPSSRQLAKKVGLSHTAVANKLREYGINKASMKL